ncbi:MAG: hypothetical protein ACYCZV_05165 [Acidimicrobiales bacterium]
MGVDDLDDLLEEILVDAYGDSEQLTSFEDAFTGSVRFPFPASIVGTPVEVVRVVFEGAERQGLTAECRRGGERYRVSLADLIPGPVTMKTYLLLSAYRRWLGLPALDGPEPSPVKAWVYQPVASRPAGLAHPLALQPMGEWDPEDHYSGEDDGERHPLVEAMIAAGPRPEFEMEQVIPGSDPEDWDTDPVTEAADLRRAGYDREATNILEGLIAEDERCIDAWVHLGNIAFDAKGPKAALELYNTAVAIGEQSLPEGFIGLLPWGLVDNRPFLRGLHGLGLCAWRQRRWDAAEVIFTNRAWIDGGTRWDSVWCLDQVYARRRWKSD